MISVENFSFGCCFGGIGMEHWNSVEVFLWLLFSGKLQEM